MRSARCMLTPMTEKQRSTNEPRIGSSLPDAEINPSAPLSLGWLFVGIAYGFTVGVMAGAAYTTWVMG